MPDIIQLLPEIVANQIAAGEVIQRPASALKELMENAIDAGATNIKVIVREAGKSLIQVIDNGCGMSETDARMSFERYATSKLRKADDLYAIRTMGFRGEALASIAAIAHVELRTRRDVDETGIQLSIEGGEFTGSLPVACNQGTSISVKNLFFNVPARRNFLKSNAAEMRHVIEEFQRVALAHPSIEFTMLHNETEVFSLRPGNFRQRIAGVFGLGYNEKLVPVEEDTTLINIKGFTGKPEFARKSRGEQYFFVNHRFIKDPYLHHAIANAFEELLPAGAFPSYFLMLEIDPAKIDVNIHPTKTEIKFEDDRSVYAILRSSVKRALGKFSVSPTLNFEQESTFNLPLSHLSQVPVPPRIQVNPSFNPFRTETEIRFPSPVKPGQDWSELYKGLADVKFATPAKNQETISLPETQGNDWIQTIPCFQLAMKYIVLPYENKLLVIDQQAAHEKVLYEKNLAAIHKHPVASQHLVFPKTLEMGPQQFNLLMEMKSELKAVGFDMSEFGKNTFVIHGVPPLVNHEEIGPTLEFLAEKFESNPETIRLEKSEKIARMLATRMAVKPGRQMLVPEMRSLLDGLFSCNLPGKSPSGKQIFYQLSADDIAQKFS